LLSDRAFAGPNAEYLKAHEHYRHGRYGESMNESLKALESTLKVICDQRKWAYKPGENVSGLIAIVFANGLIPSWLQTEFGSLRSTLESGVPTARNKVSGHGAGAQPREVPSWMAGYLLHMTASAILFLVGAHKG
jgi:uncharacterized protein DUF7014